MQFMEPTTGRQLQYVSEKEMGCKRQAEEFVWKLLHSTVQRFGCWGLALFRSNGFGRSRLKPVNSFYFWA